MPGVFVSGVWDLGSLGFWILGVYPLLRVLPLAVSLLQRVPFSNAKKEPKGFAPAYGTSLRLSVPSLRCPSGGIAYGLLRCTSSRCMRLRRTALRAFPLMDTFAQPAEGAGGSRSKARARRPDSRPACTGVRISPVAAVEPARLRSRTQSSPPLNTSYIT